MSFPLNLTMFSLLLFRAPVEYNFNVYEIGVPSFDKNEYTNDSLLFQSSDDVGINIHGNIIETQLGYGALYNNYDSTASLYFYCLPTLIYDDQEYLKENYCPLYVTDTKVDTSSFINAKYNELFKIEFNYHAPQELYIDFVVDQTFGDRADTNLFLNNRRNAKSHYYDYNYVFNVDYGVYSESSESVVSLNHSNWYSFDLKKLYNSNVTNNDTYFNINIATLPVHYENNTQWGALTQINNYICYKNDSNFSQVSYDSGYIDGYNVGKNESVDQSLWIYSFTRSVFNGFAQVLNVDILPNIKLGYLIAIPLVLSVLRFILGFFKGD